jgi:hypothetical protein
MSKKAKPIAKPMSPVLSSRYILIANLNSVTVNKVWTHSHALLLSGTHRDQNGDRISSEIDRRLCGYSTCLAGPTFTLGGVPSLEYTITPQVVGEGISTNGSILQMADGPTLELVTDDWSRPLDVQTYEGDIPREIVGQKIATYWRAPFMPALAWGPPAEMSLYVEAMGSHDPDVIRAVLQRAYDTMGRVMYQRLQALLLAAVNMHSKAGS